ncbi:MAG: OmpA family protein [Methylococcaceae bacterium]|jgi:OOP family OmpA-OmpF porin|nr:OmpA family protein [Methylococcaceae bacterium]MDZ4218589.1 OmpA family protein [Methylobacter sp.]MDP2391966.1 OmpA family protein [Methylococcaceae bacterium]MDP3018794.1 OmpA family protein [Methylococcaceae bacterium]MDP3391356.1 OmpA family protein [Methylococcaceae bacterium]
MIKKHLIALAVASTSMLSLAAQAGDFQDDRWYVAPFGSFIQPGGDRDAKGGWGGGLGVGKIINEHFNVELKGFYQGLSTDGGRNGRWDLTGGTADAQYFIFRDKFSPYTVLGLGAMNSSTNGDSGVGFIGEAGAGFTYELHDNFLIRSDVRYRYNNNFNAKLQPGTDEFHDLVVNVGFVVPLGAKHHAAPKLDVPVTPAAVVAPAPSCSTLDGDNDGVNDCNDACAGTLAGAKVDVNGCPVSLELKGVNFKVDSAVLTPNAKSILDSVAQNLINFPQKNDIEVHGHTSSEGSDSHNQKLSERRSQSVVNYLKQKGVTNRLSARGYGEKLPVADNSTQEGRELNRRVELVWSAN